MHLSTIPSLGTKLVTIETIVMGVATNYIVTMFNNKSHKMRNRRWPWLSLRLQRVFQMLPDYLTPSERTGRWIILERYNHLFTFHAGNSACLKIKLS